MNIAHLDRTDLQRLIRKLAAERNAARRAATYWHGLVKDDADSWTPERTTREATAILSLIGRDPDYLKHRRDLVANLLEAKGPQPENLRRGRKPGPRCSQGFKPCGKPLNEQGLCSRHDYRTIRALREKAAA